jgi:hypothetical protein
MKIISPLLLLLFLSPAIYFAQSTCSNRDFEDTTFTNWAGATGSNPGLLNAQTWNTGFVSNGLDAALNDALARQTLITVNYVDTNAIDPMTGLPDTFMTSLAPNGGHVSVRLGNTQAGMGMERIAQSFTVTSTNYLYTYQYACVQNDPGHTWDMQPFFMATFKDASNNVITSASDTIYAGQTGVPFITSTNGNKYRRWTYVTVDLTAYIGQTVYAIFSNSDCGYGGHWGYTYLDISCMGALTPNVWPGDCDYDLQANNVDLLSLAIAFGSTGAARINPSTNWTAQPATDWAQHFPLGANYKHSDCNGDGTVNLNDVAAIIQNYSNTHVYRSQNQASPASGTDPLLYLVPQQDTVGLNALIKVDVYIGSSTLPVKDLYGLAFSINYNDSLRNSNTISMNFTGSVLGNTPSLLSLSKQITTGNHTDIALGKIDQQEFNGYGFLGTVYIHSAAALSGVRTMPITISNIKAVNYNMVDLRLSSAGCSIVIDPSIINAVNPDINDNLKFSLYPNPAQTIVNIETSGRGSLGINLRNSLGQTVLTQTSDSAQANIDIANLPAGIYSVEITQGNQISRRSLIIAH